MSRAIGECFPNHGTHLERYATRFNAVEINSSFYRAHRPATYARWAASVPAGFRFAVKLPKAISHERRLVASDDLLARFADEISNLGDKRGPVLIQLPPSFAFDAALAARFFENAHAILGGAIVCEPRHASWFTPTAEDLFVAHRVSRVAADPAPAPGAVEPGGWPGLRYTRLHGSPRIYWSSYDEAAIERHVAAACGSGVESWTIYDNTASGAALHNALDMFSRTEAVRREIRR